MKFTKKIEKELIYEIIIFFVAVFSVSLLWDRSFILLLVLIIEWFIAVKLWHQKKDIVYFIVAGILGPVAEIVCIYFGAWSYSNPDFLGIPVWLPFLWGFVAVMLRRITLTCIKIEK